MSKFSGFIGGLQQGLDAGQTIRDRRQREKLYDTVLEQATNDIGAKKRNKQKYNLPWDEVQSEDPFGLRLFNWAKGKFGGASGLTSDTQASALGAEDPTSVAVADTLPMGGGMVDTEDPYGVSAMGFADGTGPTERELMRERLARARAAEAAPRPPPDYVNDTTAPKAKPASGPMARGASAVGGAARRALNSGTAKVGAIGALGATALTGFDTPTEDYRTRFGMETNDPSLGGDLAARTLGAASDLGNVLTGGYAGRLFRDKQQASADAELTGGGSGPIARNGPRTPAASPYMGGEMGPPSGGGSALGTPAAASTPAQNIDWSKVNQLDVPTMSTQDWQAFREERVRSYVDNGMVPADAEDKVDQQVIATQQRGMANYGRQAAALLQGGDLKGAAAALRAAYQYFPTTTDIKFGIQNGHLIGVTTDEDTGETVGEPWVVTPERVNNMLTYFANPAAFAEHAQDRRRSDQLDRQLGQADRGMDQQDQQLGISAQNAETQSLLAGAKVAGGGQPSMRPGDARQYDNDIKMGVEELVAAGQVPREQALNLSAALSALSRQLGGKVGADVLLTKWLNATPEQRQQLMMMSGVGQSALSNAGQ